MTGIIDVGGGMRDIYGAGVLDYCLDNNINFDLCIGVSAGSANLASFLAGQKGRTYHFYAEYASRKEYMSFSNMFRNGSYFDLDYIYSYLSDEDGENPLDFDTFSKSTSDYFAVVTDAETGQANYLPKNSIERNNLWAIKASCAMPVACRPYCHGKNKYFDGGVAAPLPIEKAFEMGCDKVYVILPRPAIKKNHEFSGLIKPFIKEYPEIITLMARRPEIYNSGLDAIDRYVKSGKVILISPDNDKGLNMITKNGRKLTDYYYKGYNDAERIFGSL